MNNEQKPITSATRQVRPRVLGVVFGGYLPMRYVIFKNRAINKNL